MITRDEALELVKMHIKNINLLKHCYCVEAGMRSYAEKYGGNIELWGITGLLHDIDYEEFPDAHPSENIRKWLSEQDLPEELIYCIEAHGDKGSHPRKSIMDKALHAVDSVSGIIIAAALVRPEKLDGMKPKSVIKKIRDKSFAAKMDRGRMNLGCEELGVDMTEHLEVMIRSLQGIDSELGL